MLVTALPREWEFLLTNPVLVTALPREWEFLFEDHAPDGAWLQEVYGGSIGRKDEVSLYGIYRRPWANALVLSRSRRDCAASDGADERRLREGVGRDSSREHDQCPPHPGSRAAETSGCPANDAMR